MKYCWLPVQLPSSAKEPGVFHGFIGRVRVAIAPVAQAVLILVPATATPRQPPCRGAGAVQPAAMYSCHMEAS